MLYLIRPCLMLLLLQSTVFKVLGHVAPQLGIKGIDPNDISSIPEEVYTCMYGIEECVIHITWTIEGGMNMIRTSTHVSSHQCVLQVEIYVSDPLIWHRAFKARWGSALLKSGSLFRENVARISLPLLLIHGTEDRLVPIAASHFIHDNTSSQEKNFEVG